MAPRGTVAPTVAATAPTVAATPVLRSPAAALPRPPAAVPRPARVQVVAVGNPPVGKVGNPPVGKADGTTAEGNPASSSGQKRSWADNKEQEGKYKTEHELAMVPTFMHCSFHAL